MSDSGQPVVANDILQSIDSHPGLQGNPAPTADAPQPDASSDFLNQFSGQPAATAEPEPQATQPAAPPSTTVGRLLAGKYKTVEELESAAQEAQRTIHAREAELRAVKAVNQHLEEVFAPLRNQRETPRERPIPVTFNEQQQPIVEQAAFMDAVREAATQIAREQVQETLRPLSALSSANNRLRASYPEIGQRESEFSAWLQANPDYQAKVQQDPEFYLEGAYLKFDRDRGQTVANHNADLNSAAQVQVNQARSNASPAGGTPTASRRQTEAESVGKRLQDLQKLGQETGNWKPYRDLRTEIALGKNVIDSIANTTWGT